MQTSICACSSTLTNKNAFSKLVISVLTLSIYQISHAQTTVADNGIDNVVEFVPSVVIAKAKTGTALAQKISEMPAVTQIINEEDINKQATGKRTVGEILAQLVPGISTSSGSTSNYGTTLRGRPVQFLLNGIPLTGSRNISRQLNSISPSQLERIEVLSGATSIYGAGATGGLINLVTKSADDIDGFYGQSRVGMTINNDLNGDAFGYTLGQTVGYADDSVFGRLDVDYTTKGGKFDSDNERVSPDVNQTDQQDTDTLSINANVGVNFDDNQGVSLAVTHYNNQQDTEYGPDYGKKLSVLLAGSQPSLKAVKGAKLDNQPYSKKNSVNLTYNNEDVFGSNLTLTGYYRDEKGRFYPSGRSIAAQAKTILVGAGIKDKKTLGKLLRASVAVAQSEADIDVMGIRGAMQTKTNIGGMDTLFSYGVDFEQENDKQTYYGQDVKTFVASNGLTAKANGKTYFGGPDTTVKKMGAFINIDVDLTDTLHTGYGVRYQNIKAETDAFTPLAEQLLSEYFTTIGAYGVKIPYTAGTVKSGNTDHSKVLFNAGASYQITPENQVFANFSQGFTIADIQRSLRDVRGGFVVNSDNVEPITVNSFEAGWQGKYKDTQARLTGFYNLSDKTIQFTKDYTVEVTNTDERVYGVEAGISHQINNELALGTTLAYTSGQYKEKNGDWLELSPVRIPPFKGTAFAEYSFEGDNSVRLQVLGVSDSDIAYKDNQKLAKANRKRNVLPVKGYVTSDLLAKAKLFNGYLNIGVYNLFNNDYQSVYHQSTYGSMNRLNAAGRNYGISYSIDY